MIELEQHFFSINNGSMVLASNRSPVIISVPHDGLQKLGFFQPRKIGYRGRDSHVWDIVEDILEAYTANAVRGLMPRALIDYNRAWPEGINYYPLTQKDVHTALDDARLAPYYHYYHDSIARIIDESIVRFGIEKVLLLDFHGFSKTPTYSPPGGFDVIMGTGNRITMHHGNPDVLLAEHLTNNGYQVFLPQTLALGPEEDWYSADYTTRHYADKYKINTIQIETAKKFRNKDAKVLGQGLANSFAQFLMKLYPI